MVRALLFGSLAAVAAHGAEWAVLVAGSKGWDNYRHQADVCHSYQLMKAKGIPESNIIVMAYDDIANFEFNPFPGKIFNSPTPAGTSGVDVYAGCKIDYRGAQVTPENFMQVLTGSASGRSLKSTSEDNVFIYFSDHGSAGMICFPDADLHKKDLFSTFDTMHSKKMYKKLVFYLEACESGTMLQGLNTPGVYAMTASGIGEVSYGAFCASDSVVNGTSVGDCLGDLFSVNWMENTALHDIRHESLDTQEQVVKAKTNSSWDGYNIVGSTVTQGGDLSFQTDMVSDYQGNKSGSSSAQQSKVGNVVSARNIDLLQAYYRYTSAKTSSARLAAGEKLQRVISEQMETDAAYSRFLEILYPGDVEKQAAMRQGTSPADNRECELSTREVFLQHGKFDSRTNFALQFHRIIVEACAEEARTGGNLDLAAAARQACTSPTVV